MNISQQKIVCAAILNDDLTLLRRVLRKDDVNERIVIPLHRHITPLHYAILNKKLRVMKVLLEEFNADPNLRILAYLLPPQISELYQQLQSGFTPLHQLIASDYEPYNPTSFVYQAVNLLLKYGADPDIKTIGIINEGANLSPRELADCLKIRDYEKAFEESLVEMEEGRASMFTYNGHNCRAAFERQSSQKLINGSSLSYYTNYISNSIDSSLESASIKIVDTITAFRRRFR
jgi:hypothetical protein